MTFCPTINKRHDTHLDQLFEIMGMELHMIQFIVRNMVFSYLYFTFIITIHYSWLLKRKYKSPIRIWIHIDSMLSLTTLLHSSFVVNKETTFHFLQD